MGPDALAHVLRPLAEIFPQAEYPDLLVGLAEPDDAAVYRRSDDEALVVTLDFFPPIVDDPADFGAIAAANAMSDVFAMGGEVLLALNLAAFPEDLPAEVVAKIILAGAETVRAAGGVIAGGHTVIDAEPKYGLAVVGRVNPAEILRKSGAQAGDILILTKPLGTGLVSTALKAGSAETADVAEATIWMRRLNLVAGRAARECAAHAATDITGFGLVGHASEMARASGVALVFDLAALPLLRGAYRYAAAGFSPGGTLRNREAYSSRVRVEGTMDEAWAALVYDPQTSGGLLIATDPDGAERLSAQIHEAGGEAWRVGEVRSGDGVLFIAPPSGASQ